MKWETGALGGGDVNEVVDVKSLTHQMKQEHAAWKRALFSTFKCLCIYTHQHFHS